MAPGSSTAAIEGAHDTRNVPSSSFSNRGDAACPDANGDYRPQGAGGSKTIGSWTGCGSPDVLPIAVSNPDTADSGTSTQVSGAGGVSEARAGKATPKNIDADINSAAMRFMFCPFELRVRESVVHQAFFALFRFPPTGATGSRPGQPSVMRQHYVMLDLVAQLSSCASSAVSRGV